MVSLAAIAMACSTSKGTGATGSATVGGNPAGAPCASDSACASDICAGSHCCSADCGGDPECGATACDDTGACVYPPAGTACGSSCDDAILSPRSCDGSGVCQPGAGGAPCPESFGCNDAGSCNLTCNSVLDCAPNFLCQGNRCTAPAETGPCTSNLECVSGICGADGVGNCCAAPCTSTQPPCGALACDRATGACLYADAGTPCGSVPCVYGTQTNPTLCDGLGACTTVDCAPYVCGAGVCDTSCLSNLSCIPGTWCDTPTRACCPSLTAGDALAVDSILGNDMAPCCGIGGNLPCQTIARAMGVVEASQLEDVTINATVDGGGGDWAPSDEVYPIALGGGVELSAPGIYFYTPGTPGVDAIFAIGLAATANYASIVGAAANPVRIGVDREGDLLAIQEAVLVDPGQALYLANAAVNSSPGEIAILVDGSLILGQDHSAGITGTVRVGNPPPGFSLRGGTGIRCIGCTLGDAALQGTSSVVVQGEAVDLDIEGGAVVSLTSAPILGVPPSAVGFQTCPAKPDGQGVMLTGSTRMTFGNGTVQCIAGTGFELGLAGMGVPTLVLSNTTIQNTELALDALAGTATIAGSTIRYNYNGVVQDRISAIDLSGGDAGGTNTVVCSNNVESVYYADGGPMLPGVSILDNRHFILKADNVSWDTPGPDVFSCDATLSSCACAIASCSDPAGAPGMDAVSTMGGAITTTGNKLSGANCAPPP